MSNKWTPARIRALRKHMGISQSEMAARLGYSRQQTVSELEHGAYPPSPRVGIILDMLAAQHGFDTKQE